MRHSALAPVLLTLLLASCAQPRFRSAAGLTFGTVYHITYKADADLQPQVDAALLQVDSALSMFNPQSLVSRVNQGMSDIPANRQGDMFCEVYRLATQVSQATDGAFDITVAPLVNAWGFGFRGGQAPDSAAVDSLRRMVGYAKATLTADGPRRTLTRQDDRLMLDCSAIAKGYGTDVVARLLDSLGVQNYMVEIGGEVVVRGHSPSAEAWRIGVSRPDDDTLAVDAELQAVLSLADAAVATSGNYRNFHYEGDRKVAHTIDPRTGYPVQHELLSATVVAPTCAVADAYATSFMVMGLSQARAVLAGHPELQAYLIYAAPGDSLAAWWTPGLEASLAGAAAPQ